MGTDPLADDIFCLIVENLPEAVIVSTLEGEIVYSNATLHRLLGYRGEELRGQNLSKLVPQQPGRRADVMKWLTRWAGEPNDTQSRFLDLTGRTKDGREMPVDVRVSDACLGGERRFLITVRDNSVQRETMVRNKETQLLMSRILAVAPDAIICVDKGQRIMFFNLTAEKMFGYRAEDVMGERLEMLMPERFRKRHHVEVGAFAGSKQASRFMTERGLVAGLRKDGEEFPVEATITKVTSAGQTTFTAHIREVLRTP